MNEVTPAQAAGAYERIQCQWCQGMNDKTATLPLLDARLDAIEMVARGKGEAEKLK